MKSVVGISVLALIPATLAAFVEPLTIDGKEYECKAENSQRNPKSEWYGACYKEDCVLHDGRARWPCVAQANAEAACKALDSSREEKIREQKCLRATNFAAHAKACASCKENHSEIGGQCAKIWERFYTELEPKYLNIPEDKLDVTFGEYYKKMAPGCPKFDVEDARAKGSHQGKGPMHPKIYYDNGVIPKDSSDAPKLRPKREAGDAPIRVAADGPMNCMAQYKTGITNATADYAVAIQAMCYTEFTGSADKFSIKFECEQLRPIASSVALIKSKEPVTLPNAKDCGCTNTHEVKAAAKSNGNKVYQGPVQGPSHNAASTAGGVSGNQAPQGAAQGQGQSQGQSQPQPQGKTDSQTMSRFGGSADFSTPASVPAQAGTNAVAVDECINPDAPVSCPDAEAIRKAAGQDGTEKFQQAMCGNNNGENSFFKASAKCVAAQNSPNAETVNDFKALYYGFCVKKVTGNRYALLEAEFKQVIKTLNWN